MTTYPQMQDVPTVNFWFSRGRPCATRRATSWPEAREMSVNEDHTLDAGIVFAYVRRSSPAEDKVPVDAAHGDLVKRGVSTRLYTRGHDRRDHL